MEKNENVLALIGVVVGIILVLSFFNTYSIYSLGQQMESVQKQAVETNNNLSTANITLASIAKLGGNEAAVKETEPVRDAQPQQTPVPTQAPIVEVSEDDDPFEGSADAPVTIIEFSDYECPFCARFNSQTLPALREQYIETGKVKHVFRDFPLGFHAKAQKAAEAAECAEEQDKYWEMHDKIFENQSAMGVADLKQYAADLGLNSGEFDECLDSGEMAEEVQKDLADGSKYGVSGTPTFFVNGVKLVGAQPFSAFQNLIEAELEGN